MNSQQGQIDKSELADFKELKYIGSSLLQEDVPLPAAILDSQKMPHNLAWMQNFADQHGIKLCPHGKTTMCPYLFHQQLKFGAWGITLATASQVKTTHSFKIPNILMANQLVGKSNMTIIADLLKTDPTFKFACLIDSPENVEQLGHFFKARNQQLRVLVEIGVPGGRTGVRNLAEEDEVIRALGKYSDCLKLVGVEFYEAIVKSRDGVRALIDRIRHQTQVLADRGTFVDLPIIISGAGSTWFDLVAEELSVLEIKDRNNEFNLPVELVLRPGSYLTHDIGTYHQAEQRVRSGNPWICQ